MNKLPEGATERTCCTCGIIKPFNEFHKDKYAPYGITTSCKQCRNIKGREYTRLYPEKRILYDKRSYQKHRNVCLARRKRYYQNNKEKICEYSRNHRIKNIYQAKMRRKSSWQITVGNLKRPEICENCGNKGIIHAHHDDYEDYMNITWLCTYCHARLHAKLNRRVLV